MISKKINDLFCKLREEINFIPVRIAVWLENIFGDQPCPSTDEDVIKDWNIERKLKWQSISLKETLID